MPTDIALSTNTATGSLELRQAQPMPGGGGFAAFLVVRSGGFMAAMPWFVSGAEWGEFTRALEGVTAGDGKPARLRAREGEDFIAVAGAGDGLVAVSGSLHDPDEEQLLRFRFVTGAEGLASLTRGFRAVSAG